MAEYRVLLKQSAAKELDAIGTRQDRRRLVRRIESLAEEPRPAGSRKLSGRYQYRLRQGDYRIVYSIDDAKREVVVVKIGHRKEIYRRL